MKSRGGDHVPEVRRAPRRRKFQVAVPQKLTADSLKADSACL